MTQQQVQYILNRIGRYEENNLIHLQEVSEITLTSDENIFPEDSTRVIFDGTQKILKVFHGKKNSNGEYEFPSIPRFSIDYSEIQCFILSNQYYKKVPYKFGMSM